MVMSGLRGRTATTMAPAQLDQRDELQAAGPLEMTIAVPVGVTPSTVQEIEGLTDLTIAGIEG